MDGNHPKITKRNHIGFVLIISGLMLLDEPGQGRVIQLVKYNIRVLPRMPKRVILVKSPYNRVRPIRWKLSRI